MTKTYFVDTNFFEECGVPHQLPWSDLGGPVDHVHLIVPSTVIGEIDKHKKGNGRTARRARDASALFRRALQARPDHTIEINPSNPRITLALPAVVRIDYEQYPHLDRARPDHQIAAEAATLAAGIPGSTLLSNDTNLVLAGRSIGLEPVLIPETWKLPPENDERDAEILTLKEELRKHQNAKPAVTISLAPAEGSPGESLTLSPTACCATAPETDALLERVRRAHPLATDFTRSPPALHAQLAHLATNMLTGSWQPPSEAEITRYRDQQYPEWVSAVRRKLEALPDLLNRRSREGQFRVTIANTGHANATNVRLTLTAFNGLLLQHPLDDAEQAELESDFELPKPPTPPNGRYAGGALGKILSPQVSSYRLPSIYNPDLLRSLRPQPRDPHGFYWIGGRPDEPVAELELSSDAIPHQLDERELWFRVVVPADFSGSSGRVRVRIHASNLLQTVEQFLDVAVSAPTSDFAAAAAVLLFDS